MTVQCSLSLCECVSGSSSGVTSREHAGPHGSSASPPSLVAGVATRLRAEMSVVAVVLSLLLSSGVHPAAPPCAVRPCSVNRGGGYASNCVIRNCVWTWTGGDGSGPAVRGVARPGSGADPGRVWTGGRVHRPGGSDSGRDGWRPSSTPRYTDRYNNWWGLRYGKWMKYRRGG
uniref:Uncharacterized protein n=1 Tax=Timema shepardi TaxID=629360 RepID=A0A7R9AMG3_TIMSH|nr:unnamed protein product [Timema shepardi]